jgi:membrane protease subunit (stomatin/prohibitin family)
MMRRRAVRRATGPGLVGAVGRTAVVAGTAAVVSGNVHHRQENKAMEAQAAQQQAAQAQQAEEQAAYQQAAPAEPDYMAEIERLNALKQQGVITDQEFEAKKRQILGI